MKKYNYLARTLAVAFVLALSCCKKDESLQGLMAQPASTVSPVFTSSAPAFQPSANDTANHTSCKCPAPDSSSVN